MLSAQGRLRIEVALISLKNTFECVALVRKEYETCSDVLCFISNHLAEVALSPVEGIT